MNTYAADLKRARSYLSDHVAKARRSRAFDFRQPGSFAYAYSLTWTSGSLALAGDCGEMTVTHYQALSDLKAGLRWAAGSDFDYLLSKATARRTYDADATFQRIREDLNREAINARRGDRQELQEWRRSKPSADNFPDPDGLSEELDYWRNSKPVAPEVQIDPRFTPAYRLVAGRYEAPDGWQSWLQAWAMTHVGGEPKDIFTHAGRAAILQEIEDQCQVRDQLYALKDELGYDDWYGEERWTFSDLLKIECVRKGARDALELLKYEEFEANPYVWTDTNFWGGSLPPKSAFIDWIAVTLVRETPFPHEFYWGKAALVDVLKGAERILAETLDAAGGGYNQPQHFVHVPGRYGQKGLDWSPEGAARMTIAWLADQDLFWATDEEPGIEEQSQTVRNHASHVMLEARQ